MKSSISMALTFLMLSAVITCAAQDQLRTRDRIHQEDHLRLNDGKVYLYKNGQPAEVREAMTLKNGTVINPDGSYMLQNKQRYQLRSGECLDMEGNRYMNQKMYNRREMMTTRQIERSQNQMMHRDRPGNPGRQGGRPH